MRCRIIVLPIFFGENVEELEEVAEKVESLQESTDDDREDIENADVSEVLERAKKRLARLVKMMAKSHEIGKKCMEFVAGEQWEEGEIKSRESTDRPHITINKLKNFVNVVVNKSTQERSRIKVVPFEDADTDTAKVVNGLIRHIQYSDKSDAGEAYANACFDLVSMGFGYWRVDTEFVDDESVTEQEIVIRPIDDPLSVYLDPDGNYAFVVKFIDKEVHDEEYGEHGDGNWDVPELKGDDPEDKMVVEYWELSKTDIELYKIELADSIVGDIPTEANIDEAINAEVAGPVRKNIITVTEEELANYPGAIPIASRKSKKSSVKRYLFSGDDLVDSSDWAGKYIPIIGCYGRKFKLKTGEFFYDPLVYSALDPQKYYNYLKSQDAELMMMAPKNPWIGAEGQFAGHEDEFRLSNTAHVPYLEYKPVDLNGQLAPPPQRTAPPQVNAAFYQNMMQANDEIKACIGMYDASLGAQGNESSGRAIIARKNQGDLSTYHFIQAINVGLRQTGLVIVDLHPKIYDTARTIRILGEDMADEVVKINQPFVDPRTGEQKKYDMTVGKYDIKIETGPSNVTRRLENLDLMMEVAKQIPIIGQTSPDLIIKNIDHEYSDEMALRAKAGLDPELLARVKQMQDEGNGGPTQEQLAMQKMQQALQGMQQQLQQVQTVAAGLAKQNQAMQAKIKNDAIVIESIKAQAGITEKKIEAAADVRVAQIQNRPQGFENNPMSMQAVAPVGMRNNMAMQNYSNGGRQ